jgi:thiosulfate/3-mercaptopyruvate sulfurtransferase
VWKDGHLPGSFSFSWESYTRTDEKKIPWRIFGSEELAAILGDMGIDEHTPVAAYGDMETSWGGEAWICWVLSWMGHKGPVRLVQGGMDAWQKAGFETSSGPESGIIVPTQYRVNLRPELNTSAGALEKMTGDAFIVDTRSFREWIGGDRLPGAVHINWKHFISDPDNTPINASELAGLLNENGVTFEKPVIYYCTGGIRSSVAWLVHQLSEKGMPVNYEGGTEEWTRRNRIP